MLIDAPIVIEAVSDACDLGAAMAIREAVFITEQQMTESDPDEYDAVAFHVLARSRERVIGTGRLVMLQAPPAGAAGRWGKIGRMAVLAGCRGRGVGRRILAALEQEARGRGLGGIVLHAEVAARAFYERAGYGATSAIFDEGGLPCLEMRKLLEDPA